MRVQALSSQSWASEAKTASPFKNLQPNTNQSLSRVTRRRFRDPCPGHLMYRHLYSGSGCTLSTVAASNRSPRANFCLATSPYVVMNDIFPCNPY